MDIIEKFLELTSKTYPHGTEEGLYDILPEKLQKDELGNLFIEIGEEYNSMFTSHLDTADFHQETVNHMFREEDGMKMVGTDGSTILGADCKAGVVIMLNMIENEIPGLYYFFLGEEVGCVGSRWLSEKMKNGEVFNGNKINKCVSFDRRNVHSIITHQARGRCASDTFADALIEEYGKLGLDMEKDDGGILTDSIQFQSFIPECTNISVGYYNEHTGREIQDLTFLENIAKASVSVNWEELPSERKPVEFSYRPRHKNTWSIENQVNVSYSNGEVVTVVLSDSQIEDEKETIIELFQESGTELEESDITWDGTKLVISNLEEEPISRGDLISLQKKLFKKEYLKRYSLASIPNHNMMELSEFEIEEEE